MIKAVIFDMDGLLVDSKPIWEEAEVESFNKIGVPLTMEKTKETMGLRVDEVVKYWYSKYPWHKPSKKGVETEIVKKVIELINKKGKTCEGVLEIINLLKRQNIPMALASSSQTEIIDAVLDRIDIRDYIRLICSAEHEPFGKPHPGIYTTTAKKLGLRPEDCLVFEDSFNGLLAAKAGSMKCVCVPDEGLRRSPKLAIADAVINSLADFDEGMWKKFNV